MYRDDIAKYLPDFTEVPNKEFQLFFKNYPKPTYPALQHSCQVNLGVYQRFAHCNYDDEIVGIFENWNCWEKESRYFIRSDLVEYVNDKDSFGTYHYNEWWHYGFGRWQCPECGNCVSETIPPSECPECHSKLNYDKDKGFYHSDD